MEAVLRVGGRGREGDCVCGGGGEGGGEGGGRYMARMMVSKGERYLKDLDDSFTSKSFK